MKKAQARTHTYIPSHITINYRAVEVVRDLVSFPSEQHIAPVRRLRGSPKGALAECRKLEQPASMHAFPQLETSARAFQAVSRMEAVHGRIHRNRRRFIPGGRQIAAAISAFEPLAATASSGLHHVGRWRDRRGFRIILIARE
jgi:hypothetical protein